MDLVSLLTYGGSRRPLHQAISAAIGNRGRWLAAKNPEWSYAAGLDTEKGDWRTSGREWRLAELTRLRASDPSRARELVASTWSEETHTDRAAFLGTFAVGSSMDDEPFVEAALDDKRIEVRRAAAAIVSRLADSRYCQRAIDRIGPLIQFADREGRLQIEISLLAEYTKDMARDAIDKSIKGMGEKNAWTSQMLAIVPPAHWTNLSGRTALELHEAAERSEWKELLHAGWAHAARRHGDVEWLEACVAYRRRRGVEESSDLPSLLACMPAQRQEKILAEILWSATSALDDPAALLACVNAPWGNELSHAVIEFLQGMALARAGPFQSRLPPALQIAAVRMPPSFADEMAEKVLSAATVLPGLSGTGREGDVGHLEFPTRDAHGVAVMTMSSLLREHAEDQYSAELAELKRTDDRTRPPNWQLSPWGVATYLLGGTLADGFEVTPKYIGNRRLIEIAIATLATDRSLLLLGVPGTAKSWVSEHLSAAIAGDSTLLIQGTSGTSEESIRYGWNYARLLAEGPSLNALVASPILVAMRGGQDRPRRGADKDSGRRPGQPDHDPLRKDPADPRAR